MNLLSLDVMVVDIKLTGDSHGGTVSSYELMVAAQQLAHQRVLMFKWHFYDYSEEQKMFLVTSDLHVHDNIVQWDTASAFFIWFQPRQSNFDAKIAQLFCKLHIYKYLQLVKIV